MPTIVVTGACGGVGEWTVECFVREGHDVVGFDRRTPDGTRKNVSFKAPDLSDYGETKQVAEAADPDSVVHLAPIPHPEDRAVRERFDPKTVELSGSAWVSARPDPRRGPTPSCGRRTTPQPPSRRVCT